MRSIFLGFFSLAAKDKTLETLADLLAAFWHPWCLIYAQLSQSGFPHVGRSGCLAASWPAQQRGPRSAHAFTSNANY